MTKCPCCGADPADYYAERRRRIFDACFDEKLKLRGPTVKDIAASFGVSASTASQAMKQEAKRRKVAHLIWINMGDWVNAQEELGRPLPRDEFIEMLRAGWRRKKVKTEIERNFNRIADTTH